MVTGLEISKREVVLDGKPFGDAGAYEKVVGTIRYAADPAHALHRQITDIDRAPKNRDGLVEFSADFYLLKPVDARKGNGRLLVDVPNRGRKVAIEIFNSTPRVPDPSAPEHFGNGFLMRHGFTVAWIGWQPDVPRQDGLMVLDVPRAKGVTGWLRTQRRPNEAADVLPLADRYHVPYPTIDVKDPEARIVMRERAGAPAVEIPRAQWRFVDEGHVKLDGGFKPGALYEFFYRSCDPTIVGLGFLAVRDVAAFLRWGPADSNPCAGSLERAYLFGVSQSGRFIRHMLFLGLDEDEQGRMVYDGIMPHVAGGRRGEFNLRFGQPSINATVSVGSLPPFNDDGVFARLKQRGRIPKIIATNSSPEYWRGDASLIHTEIDGARDAEPAPFVRTYLFAGTQHTPTSVPPAAANASTGDRGYHPFNIVNYSPLLRCALKNLDRWVSEGVEPPASVFPRLSEKTAVQGESLAAFYEKIPGTRFPVRLPRPSRLDFGPEIDKGIPHYPPKVAETYRTYVSTVDADGNEVAGLRGAELDAPLATLTGWNTRHPDTGAAGDIMSMNGSTLAFPRTKAERERTGDPRLSIEERYPSKAAYLERVREVTREAIARRHVLAEDLETVVDRASKTWDWIHASKA
ncbi:MAG TPA: alpha/beta hydrolase domain-containing protein [Burkholderiales bacterium]|nr:alpha/beta hydrolase domain-containing protein [Burkholderiales bacterium]